MERTERAVRESARPILIVDDDQLIRWTVAARLRRTGYEVTAVSSGREALTALSETGASLILLDCRLPGEDGLAVLAKVRDRWPMIPVIVMTGYASIGHAVTAMKRGASDYIEKPIDLDDVVRVVGRTLDAADQRVDTSGKSAPCDALQQIVGESDEIRALKALVCRVARSPVTTVLVTGESGTGKDLVARAIHGESERASGPFVNVTCSAVPTPLLESELFGHERGAFTDARSQRQGLLEHADRGTVFLDEIGEIEPAVQSKLLGFLESKRFRRVGGGEELRADVRIIAATNVDLRRAVAAHRFREDLYYRIAVVRIHLPPLRDREGDIDRLVEHFLDHFNRRLGKDVRALTPEAAQRLRHHAWPGNVRELRNAVERAVLLARGPLLAVEDFDFLDDTPIEEAIVRLPANGVDVRDVERCLVEQALERTGGNKTRAAKLLGMNRDQIRYRMRRYGLAEQRDVG